MLREVATHIAGYFRDFIETDFKRVQAPSRRIVLQNESGFRCGMRLKPYDKLDRDIWNLLQQPSGEPMALRLGPRKYIRALSSIVQKVIEEQLAELDPQDLAAVKAELAAEIDRSFAKAVSDPEEWVEATIDTLCEQLAAKIIRPLIAKLDGPLQRQAYSVIDSLYAAETDMVSAVASELATKLPEILAKHLAKRDDAGVRAALDTFLTMEHTREALERFFGNFVAADAYHEFRDVETYAAISEGVGLYLNIGSCRYRGATYPLFFLPVQAEKLPDASGYELTVINQLFANRAAIDFVLQELAATRTRGWTSPITERINYLQPQQSVFEEARRLFELVANAMDLAGQIHLGATATDASTADVVLGSGLYLCASEKGAESLVNDYEALIDMARQGGGAVVDLFEKLVQGVLQENPKSIRATVETEWDGLSLVDRMVFDSPIPLNEEQRKILMAVRHPEGRIVVVEGPPGTGKSHTITAIAADCAFNQRSCLVLSDKVEALDVVQDKLSQAMSRVRHDSNFPNPLLRLGRQNANFKKLVGNQTVNQVAAYAKANAVNAPHIEQERRSTAEGMKVAIEKTVKSLGAIELKQVQQLHEAEVKVQRIAPAALEAIHALAPDDGLLRRLTAATALMDQITRYFDGLPPDARRNAQWLKVRAKRDHALWEFAQQHSQKLAAMGLYEKIDADELRQVSAAIVEYRQLRMPVLGYLLRGSAVRAIESRLNALPARRPILLKSEAAALELLVQGGMDLRLRLDQVGLQAGLQGAWQQLISQVPDGQAAQALLGVVEALAGHEAILADMIAATPEQFRLLAGYLGDWIKVRQSFRETPEFDYVGTKTKMEALNTSRMNAHVDSRLVDFMENHRADAKTLAQLISQRQKFPEEKFDAVRSSFPVMIAGIREFGEYMPLVPELFDVVVIDEASQVSVAQALPALLRAKKIVVLGDSKQFANVKSSNASVATNEKYRSNLVSFFEKTVQRDAATLQRLAMFDVKKSILEFCSLAASYTIMLRKHFRSYPELISYSSRSFYDGHLQAIKIRGVPIDEVIRFDLVETTDKAVSRTTNMAEVEFIAERLVELLDEDAPPSVGVITPFREQHTLLTKTLFAHERAGEFEDKLRLKVMTFDSCQGEERSIIFYSMVATAGNDALNYVFPVSLDGAAEAIEEKLKVQRLNVGFSRAQDTIWIVHSMPLGMYRGAIGGALNHYLSLQNAKLGSAEQTDPASPMEAKLLNWLQATKFIQAQLEDVEILPQFPLGDYLKQLDPTYQHPSYRVDFLLTCQTPKGPVQIVVEYDGFEHHFQPGAQVHIGNHERYLREGDVERQLTLESYGYRFVRVNRFNLGSDPVATLDERLSRIIEVATGEQHSQFVERLRQQAEGMVSGDMRQCTRCKTIHSREDFFDPALGRGAGGYGRVCMDCKRAQAAKPQEQKTPSSWRGRRRWSRY
ncbi:AAA domain-containing protein [Sphaerotilaceae bacterium SBD11-9]